MGVHAVRGPAHLVGKRFLARRQRLGVRHLEDRRDAAEHGGARTCLQILLVLQSRLAKMRLTVDHSRQHMQASAVDCLGGAGLPEVSDGRDPPAAHAYVAHALAVVIDDGAVVFQDQIIGRSAAMPLLRKLTRLT